MTISSAIERMRPAHQQRKWTLLARLGLAVGSAWLSFLAAAAETTPPRWLAEGDRVYDRKTDLTWQRCVYGQRYDPARSVCGGLPKALTFDAAKNLESQGWRVPRLDELVSLVVRGAAPTIDSTVFPGTPAAYFWATDNRDLTAAWYVSFEDGRTNHYFPPRTNLDLVRFVRSGRWRADAGPVPRAASGP